MLLRVFFRLKVVNRPQIDGPFILAANHSSFLDPLLLGASQWRRICFMMTVLHFRSPKLGWFYRWMRSIPLAVRGGGNRQALRTAHTVLRRGEVIGIFPEGGLARDDGLFLGSPGAVSLVLAEDVPIVPCYIHNAHTALPIGGKLRFPRITVEFGEPLTKAELIAGAEDRRSRLKVATREIMERIAALGGVESRESEMERLRGSKAG
ncbi:MAG: lysophospholipid acyltransferase family protein [Planctomycetota bacterium]